MPQYAFFKKKVRKSNYFISFSQILIVLTLALSANSSIVLISSSLNSMFTDQPHLQHGKPLLLQ